MTAAVQVQPSDAITQEIPVPPAVGQPQWTVQSHGMTHPGKARSNNEDQFLVATMAKALRIHQTSLPRTRVHYSDERGYLFVVADGMGGAQAGEQASAMAVDAIEEFVLNTFQWFFHLRGPEGQPLLSEFHEALRQVDAAIYREAGRHSELWGMGTTLTMAYSLNRDLFIAHVGDSRCYLRRQGVLHQLTHDHTLVEEMVRRGVLPAEEASHHQLRHVITNVLGSTEPGVKPEVHKVQLESGDLLLLCSDGLTEMVSNEDINRLLGEEADLRATCETLIALANEKGGKDNITVVLGRYEEEAGKP